jgi:hypothetical protein
VEVSGDLDLRECGIEKAALESGPRSERKEDGMSTKLICDYCGAPIEGGKGHMVEIDRKAETPLSHGKDMCFDCYQSPVILSEHRRTRTRKPAKPKVGRPKGSVKKREAASEPPEPPPMPSANIDFGYPPVPGNLGTVEHPAAIPARVTEAVGEGLSAIKRGRHVASMPE